MRITRKVFTDLAIYMMGFGLLIGIIFPIFSMIIGIPEQYLTTLFITSCVIAGLMVGLVNILLARLIVGRRIKKLSESMNYVNENLEKSAEMDAEECLKKCMLPVDSDDELGESSRAFNNLVKSFLTTLKSETSIRNFTEIFTNELDVEKLSDKALSHLIEYTNSTAGVILIDKSGEIEVASSHLIKNPMKLTTTELVRKAFDNNKRVFFELANEVTIEAGLIDFHPKTILLEPVSYKNDVLGVILLASTKEYDKQAIDQLNTYTHGLSLGMQNAIVHDKLEQLAILDPLTKTYNRRFGLERLKEEFGRSIRTNNPLGILMFDIDFFKKVNDTYGHIVGDQVLIGISEILRVNLRKGDILVRYGGEEFMALLPGASNEGLEKVSEKIRRYVEEHIVKYKEQEIKVTISIGGTSIPEQDYESIEQFIDIADNHLYEAKDSGRNRVIVK